MRKKLIGAQIVTINEDEIVIKLNDKEYTLRISAWQGACCGYANFKTKILYSEGSLQNPIITNVELVKEENYYSGLSKLTFYGEDLALASIESVVGSDSGYYYGATVEIYCKSLEIDEILAEW